MYQNGCYFCRSAAKKAWRELTEFFNDRKPIEVDAVEYYRTLLLMAYRVSIQDKHVSAGHALQSLISLPERCLDALRLARRIEIDEPISYPKYLYNLLNRIAERGRVALTRDDFKRYGHYIDEEMMDKLFGEVE